jgi:hypothetical protein
LSIHEWEVYPNLLKVIFAVVSKLGVASVCALLIYYGLTELGLTAGTMVVLGPLLLVILVIQILSTLLVAFSAIMFENTWPAVILSAFILALVVISSLPLI